MVRKRGKKSEASPSYCISSYKNVTINTYRMETYAWTGKTVALRERNGYEDSDFYVTYWDGEKFVEELHGTTRYAYYCQAEIDASEEIRELWKEELRARRQREKERAEKEEAENPTVGKKVEVLKGRKYKGEIGIITWRGVNKFKTFYPGGYRDPHSLFNQVLCIKTESGKSFFVPADYVIVLEKEKSTM